MHVRAAAIVLFMLALAACSTGSSYHARSEQHIVRKGETLY
jgi:hypothetical protein